MVKETRPLGTFLDSLYLNIDGTIAEGTTESLRECKQSLWADEEWYRKIEKKVKAASARDVDWRQELTEQEQNHLLKGRETDWKRKEYGEIEGVPGGTFYLQSSGTGHYPYILRNNLIYMQVTSRPNLPAIRLQYLAHALYRYDFKELEDFSRAIGLHFDMARVRVQVSRADIAADFQPPEGWRPPEMSEIACMAKSRTVHYNGEAVESITIGTPKAGLQVQLYNKRAEILHSGKDWMEDIWQEYNPDYDPESPVWRLELRVFRPLLRQFEDKLYGKGIETIENLENSMGDIVALTFDCRTLGEDKETQGWLRIIDPDSSDSNRSRSPSAKWFDKLAGTMGRGFKKTGRVRKYVRNCTMSLTSKIYETYQALTRCAAVARAELDSDPEGGCTANYKDFILWLATQFHEEESIPDHNWEDHVRLRMERMSLSPAIG